MLSLLTKVASRLAALVVCCFTLALACVTVSAQAGYGIVELGTLPGGTSSTGAGINNNGQAVGSAVLPTLRRAFIYSNGTMSELLPAYHAANGGFSAATAINDAGQVTGSVSIAANNFTARAFVLSGGNLTILDRFGGIGGSSATAINTAGTVVGASSSSDGSRAFVYSNGVMTNLGVLSVGTDNSSQAWSINDAGQVVGVSSTSTPFSLRAFLWKDGVMQNLGVLPNAVQSAAMDINNSGQVVGYANIPSPFVQVPHAFLWTSANGMIDLGSLGGGGTIPRSINDSGAIVGYSTTADNRVHPFIYRNGVMTDLMTLLPAGHCFTSVEVLAINNDGTIVGTGTFANRQSRAILLVPGSTAGGGQNCGGAPPPPPTPAEVIAQIRAIVSNVDNVGVATSMDVKLRNVLNAMGDTDKAAACNHLSVFDKELSAQDGKHITGGDAVVLRLKVGQLAGMLGCG